MSHPGWCVVEEAHSAEDCHRNLIEGEQCQAKTWQGYRAYRCPNRAKGWKRMFLSAPIGSERTLPACGVHMRATLPGAF